MIPQLSLTYRPAHVGSEAWALQLKTLRAAVDYLGLKEVAYELDVNRSTLCDSLNERDRKRWAAEWTHVVKAMLAARYDEIAPGLLRAIVEADITTAPALLLEERNELTGAQIAAAYGSLDDSGKRALAKLLGGRR